MHVWTIESDSDTRAVSPLCVVLQFVFYDVHQFVPGVQSGGETRRPQRNLNIDWSRDQACEGHKLAHKRHRVKDTREKKYISWAEKKRDVVNILQ